MRNQQLPRVIAASAIFLAGLAGAQYSSATVYVVSSTADGGAGALRSQIVGANLNPGADQITFAIPGTGPHTIHLLSPLPDITDTLEIDGTTQPGFAGSPVIELDGTAAGATADGLRLLVSKCRVQGLAINRFGHNGIVVRCAAENCAIKGNYIGTDITGAFDMGNGWNGIYLTITDNDTIGGTTAAERNVISGNDSSGVCAYCTQGWALVVGNYIGTDATGTGSLGNGTHGVEAVWNSSLYVGGPLAGQGNLISGNDSCGVCIHDNGAYLCRIEGNYIGTDVTGTVPLGNTRSGVYIRNARGNQIGETTASARNVISSNVGYGIHIDGSASTGNVIEGNYIGTDVTGTVALSSGSAGVFVTSAAGNTIGGASPGARNIISGGFWGIYVDHADSTLVQGNYIGTDVNGTADLGNLNHGVAVYAGTGNTIGGASPGAGNIISCNHTSGIALFFAHETVVQGNSIGSDASGSADLGNWDDGIIIWDGTDNMIGGTDPATSNIISHNGLQGILVCDNGATGNAIRGNSIHSNGALGIDLTSTWPADGPAHNDSCDLDTGPNNFQNYPVLTLQSAGPPLTLVDVFLNSTPNTAFRFEFFENSQQDPIGYGEGETFIGWADLQTDALGNVSFTVFFDPPIQPGHCITATATDPTGNTSEFSQVVYVGEGITLTGQTAGGALQLNWTALPGAGAYQIYGAENEAYFEVGPSHFMFELPPAVTTWSGLPAVGDVDHNWTYVVVAIGDYGQEMARSNRFGEFDFGAGTP